MSHTIFFIWLLSHCILKLPWSDTKVTMIWWDELSWAVSNIHKERRPMNSPSFIIADKLMIGPVHNASHSLTFHTLLSFRVICAAWSLLMSYRYWWYLRSGLQKTTACLIEFTVVLDTGLDAGLASLFFCGAPFGIDLAMVVYNLKPIVVMTDAINAFCSKQYPPLRQTMNCFVMKSFKRLNQKLCETFLSGML